MAQNVNRTALIAGGGVLGLLAAGLVAFLVAGSQDATNSGSGASSESGLAERSAAEQPPGTGNAAARAGENAAPPNEIARQAGAWGVARCSREIALVSEFLTRNTVYSARSMRGPHDADGEVFSATIVARTRDGGAKTVSTMTVAPVSAGRCNVIYETTAHFPSDCETVRAARFGDFAEPMDFGDLARAYATPGDDGQLYMLPTGEGCLVKKTQSLY